MKRSDPSPPRLASALLGLCLPPGALGDSLLGDLHEAYLEMMTPGGRGVGSQVGVEREGSGPPVSPLRASLWYWSQVPLVGGRYLIRRLAHRRLYREMNPGPDRPVEIPTKGSIVADLWRDFRQTLRSLRRSPGFLIANVLVLGIGIGAISLMFSTFNAVVLQPLPFPEPDRLVWVWGSSERMPRNTVSYADYVDYRDGTDAFEELGALMVFQRRRILTGGEGAEQVVTYPVSHNLFAALGVPPELGRTFLPEEEVTGHDGVAILSQGFWQDRYAGDPAVIGSTITLDGERAEVVGVMPAGFDYPSGTDVWFPLQRGAGYADGRNNNNFALIGRLREGASMSLAQAQMDVVARNIADSYPDEKAGVGVMLVSLHERFFGSARTTLLILLGIISLVPLVACANVASLFMARAVSRRAELASRLALGASRARVVRQLLTEGLVVALAGGGVGLALAYGGGVALRSLAPGALPRLSEIGVDGSVLAFTLAASFLMVPLFGLAPAIRGTDMRIAETLKAGEERGGGLKGSRFRSLLVVGQVALSLMLLLASGLFVRTFVNLQRVDLGFRTEGVLRVYTLLPAFKYMSPEEFEQAWGDVERRLRAVPGVREVGFADRMPLGGRGPLNGVWASERPPASAAEMLPATRRFASEGYFRALGIPLLAGRHFDREERWLGSAAPGAVVINEALARQFFPGEDPLGKTLVLNWDVPVDLEVIGLTGDIREAGLGSDPLPTFYLPARWEYDMLHVFLRTVGDPVSLAGAVRAALREVDDDITIATIQTLEAGVGNLLLQPQFRLIVVGLFALVALILTSIGLYGVLAYFVRQRSHEISVRLALGAGTKGVAGLVLRRGLTLSGIGILIGVAGALAGVRVMQSWVYGISVVDPLTFIGVSFCLATVASLACVIPALRAARLDPAEVMKAE